MLESNTLLILGGLMLFAGILAKVISDRFKLPLLLLFLIVGMLTGEDGIVGIEFDNFQVAFVASNLALAVILLDGGLRTSLQSFRTALGAASTLATVGVILTAGGVGLFATWLLDIDWRLGLLLGAIVGSTDAAAVFNLLGQSGIQLNERVRSTLEIESGANDPMAILLVLVLLEYIALQDQAPNFVTALVMLGQQFGLGALAGCLGGWILARLIGNLRLSEGLYSLLVLSGGIVIFAGVNMLGGSGFLAIYLTGILVAKKPEQATEHVKLAMDGFAWLAQAGLFLILGLLVTPSHLVQYLLVGLAIAIFQMFIARPAAVFLCLLPFRFPVREITYISWVGLRGAVPIVLAIFPTMAGLSESELLFDITFVVVFVSLVIQGSTVPTVARWLKVLIPYRAQPFEQQMLWLSKKENVELVAFTVEEDSPAQGSKPAQLNCLKIPGLELFQLVRHGQRYAPADSLFFQESDVLWMICEPGHTERLADFFSHRDRSGELANRSFFGEFVIGGDSSAADLARSYGVALSDQQMGCTIGELIRLSKGRRIVVGDRVALGPIRLTVRTMEGSRILTVGLKV